MHSFINHSRLDFPFFAQVSPNVLSGTDGVEVVFLRVATVGANDRMDKSDLETRVMKASPVFYVYVPGEPYFYASASKPCPDTCEGEKMRKKCTLDSDFRLRSTKATLPL